jgi:hypothetical protein
MAGGEVRGRYRKSDAMNVPSGTVNILRNGNTVAFNQPLDANGNASYQYTTSAGDEPQDVFSVVYNNDSTHNPSSGTCSVPVTDPVQNTVTTVTPSPTSVQAGQVVTLAINVANAS